MKIIRIDRLPDCWPQELAAVVSSPEATPEMVIGARLIADSGVVRNNRPVFVPDFALNREWRLEVSPIVTIGRLGKYISPKFASRHIAGIGLAGYLRRDGDNLPNALTDSFDGVMVIGEIYPYDEGRESLQVTATMKTVSANGEETLEKSMLMEFRKLHVEETVALVSRYATLKSGDVIMPVRNQAMAFPVSIGSSLTAILDGAEALSLRLK